MEYHLKIAFTGGGIYIATVLGTPSEELILRAMKSHEYRWWAQASNQPAHETNGVGHKSSRSFRKTARKPTYRSVVDAGVYYAAFFPANGTDVALAGVYDTPEAEFRSPTYAKKHKRSPGMFVMQKVSTRQ